MKLQNKLIAFPLTVPPLSVTAQSGGKPFLEIRPYEIPPDGPYPVHAQVDHLYPTQTSNHQFVRFDGFTTQSIDPPAATFTIATMDPPAGSDCAVILRDVVSPEANGSFVVFDTIR